MLNRNERQTSALIRSVFRRRKISADPFAVTNNKLLGKHMKFMTHNQDRVLGAMIRGDIPLCPHFQAELAWLKEQIRPGDFVLDAGGNMGSVSIALSLYEKKAFICAFEPDPLNYGLLQVNLAFNECANVNAFNLALGNTDELIDFYSSPDNFGDHRSFKPKGLDLREEEFVRLKKPVSKVKASRFLQQCYPDRQLDLVKIDTQGAEFEILEEIIPLTGPETKIAIEFSPYHIDSNKTSRKRVFDLLSNYKHILRIKPKSVGLYTLEKISCNKLRQFYDEQYARYKTYYDLILQN
ncbi:FkbM family methyltransferase [Gammaproteobacteria bacterium]|nr:FkbM family methyltransferase [Gammaproteobacteria bacterium]